MHTDCLWLDHFVCRFHLAICLRVIRRGFPVPDLVLLHHTLYQIRNKPQTIVRNNFSRHTKSSKYFSKKKINNNFFVAKETALASTHFVTKSLQTKIFFLLKDVGFIGPIKSIAHFWNGSIIAWGHKGISLVLLGCPIRWQISHRLAYYLASLKKEGQK